MAPTTFLISCLLVAAAVISPSLLQPSAAFMIPCIPFLPKIPFLPCYQPPPDPPLKEVTECWTPLMKMMPCAAFLTNASVTEPSPACCTGFSSVADDGGTICFCHVGNGDVAKLLPAPMNSTRMFSLPVICNFNLRLEPLAHCNPEKNGVPPMTPPSHAPSSSSAP
ncbi:hypothetical protein BS78_10G255500 [Paspalum vaginatum]|nr:hypothetical protein BS78_10G255500 [Paspalum vaginatum]KAJ1260739.1 hypothetical protein BS78_10G255500 [Paspalum vaginatum]